MTITKEKIKEAVNILIGRQTPFSDSDIKWSKEVIEKAFSEGYDIEVVCPSVTIERKSMIELDTIKELFK